MDLVETTRALPSFLSRQVAQAIVFSFCIAVYGVIERYSQTSVSVPIPSIQLISKTKVGRLKPLANCGREIVPFPPIWVMGYDCEDILGVRSGEFEEGAD
jgi:hypothetical protein